MEQTKKMILVDPRVMESGGFTTPPIPDARAQSIREMDQQMREALEDRELNPEDKANAYNQILWKYLKRVDQFKGKAVPTTSPGPAMTTTTTTTEESQGTSEVEKSSSSD